MLNTTRFKTIFYLDYFKPWKLYWDIRIYRMELKINSRLNQFYPGNYGSNLQLGNMFGLSYVLAILCVLSGKLDSKTANEIMVSDLPDFTYQDSVQLISASNYKEKFKYYVVERSDTLMKLSIEFYGNTSKWRDLYRWNEDHVGDGGNLIRVGQTLRYLAPEDPPEKPSGKPYLIKDGDTLGKISEKLYGTTDNWRMIWKHNSNIIKDPDLIYAGTTIFYPVRRPASRNE